MSRDPLPLELLVSKDTRRERVTVERHTAFRKSITPPALDPYDEIDWQVADAELDLQPRARRQVNSILRTLDKLETGRGR
jgi:hypothetical protein